MKGDTKKLSNSDGKCKIPRPHQYKMTSKPYRLSQMCPIVACRITLSNSQFRSFRFPQIVRVIIRLLEDKITQMENHSSM